MNTDHPDVQLSSTLTELRDFTAGFDPATRGLALSNSDVIRTVHNSFARCGSGDGERQKRGNLRRGCVEGDVEMREREGGEVLKSSNG